MTSFPLPDEESERLAALKSYNILDTLAENDYDELAGLAALICGTPFALITLLDQDREWFKSHAAIDLSETPRKASFCACLTVSGADILIVEDARRDDRFAANPLVTIQPGIAFYAGVPLVNRHGYILGALCVIGRDEQRLRPYQINALKILSKQVMGKLEHRRDSADMKAAYKTIDRLIARYTDSEQRNLLRVKHAPVAAGILAGRQLIVEAANEELLKAWGKSGTIIGQPLHLALPELESQPFLRLLDDVFVSGKPFYGHEIKASLERDGKKGEYYFNFVYHPVKDLYGNTKSIMVVATETQKQPLPLPQQTTARSRAGMLDLLMRVPFGMTILKGLDFRIEVANQPMLDLWNRSATDMIGNSLVELFPELNHQPFPTMLAEVFSSGKPLVDNEAVIDITDASGTPRKLNVNFTYEPLFDQQGTVDSVLVSVLNITDTIKTREELIETRENLRLAVDSAHLGLWTYVPTTDRLIFSDRARQLHGLIGEQEFFLSDYIQRVLPAHREMLLQAITATGNNEHDLEVEFVVNTFDNDRPIWLHATGTAVNDQKHHPSRITGMFMDITARKQQEHLKNDFIAMASHELKTPLTSVKGFVQLLTARAQRSGDDFAKSALDRILLQTNKMQRMIHGFLDVSRIEAGKMSLNKQPFVLNELLTEEIAEAAFIAPGAKFDFRLSRRVSVTADRDKIALVVQNLLSNALKYSLKEKRVIIRCRQKTDRVVVSIIDKGMGIAQSEVEKLFDRFYRVKNADTKAITGFGVGLYLSAEIIKLHEGRIWVKSQPGKGSAFYFDLPAE